MCIVSQWIQAPQQQPVWIIEQPCLGGADADDTLVTEYQLSEEYLIAVVHVYSVAMSVGPIDGTLYAWHLSALHLPPRLIMSKYTGTISLYKNWLVVQKDFANGNTPSITFVFDLAKHTSRPGILEIQANKRQIQSATEDSIRLLWGDEIRRKASNAMISWQLWDFAPDRAPPTQCSAICETEFYTDDNSLRSCRIDDSSFVVFSRTSWKDSADTTPPTIALMELTESNTGVTMKERWSIAQELKDIRPIVSQNMLLVELPHNGHRLLNLNDGTLIHGVPIVALNCWLRSDLYPLRRQWADIIKHIPPEQFKDQCKPFCDSVEASSKSPNATLRLANGIPIVVDFSP
ncbi:hypothetical protein THASP1DRAFT_29609 [Thamnocephalis sphaerospora]|uniref:Uncharacterized protein n=1 Tax=Thamnocephalis sphaerospora TaxID=78915 RepID=A0A4P9XRK7_9FUNG|nr:hypothetical protein THASP1DRAFT_29609 [Thamnocephalis sphaerospora]|eukprot:RKP08582.1 hypothetical protein THASP1DRAFT_29609 [Thamnocephalis sphaerospora]